MTSRSSPRRGKASEAGARETGDKIVYQSVAQPDPIPDRHPHPFHNILDRVDASGLAAGLPIGETGALVCQRIIRHASGTGDQTTVERPDLAGELAPIAGIEWWR